MDENRIAQIEAELQRLNQRIDNLKSLLLGAQAQGAQAPALPAAKPVAGVPPVIVQASAQPFAKAPQASSSIGKYASLGVVSVVFFLLAAAYALKLAYHSGVLTPQGILFLLTTVGVGLIGSGYMAFTSDKKYQSFLPVTGVLILNGVFYTATAVYGLLNPTFALVVALGISGLGIFLYEEFKYDVYWIISVLGAYFFPNLLQLTSDTVLWNTFLVISSMGFVAASIFVNKRPISLMACVCAFIAVASRQSEYTDLMPVVFLTIHLAVFLAGFVIYFRKSKKFLEFSEALALFVVGVFFFIYSNILSRTAGDQAELTVALAALAGFWLLQVYVTKFLLTHEEKDKSHAADALNALLYFMVSYLGFVIAFAAQWRPGFVLVMLAATVVLLPNILSKTYRLLPRVVGVCLAGMFFYEYAFFIWSAGKDFQMLTWFWMLIWGLIIVFSEKYLTDLPALKDVSQKFWVGFYGLAHVILLKLVFDFAAYFEQSDFKVFFVAIYAALFVFLGFKLKLKNLAKSALPILVFISALLLFSLGTVSPVAKIISFLGAGAAFWGAGFLLRKVDKI